MRSPLRHLPPLALLACLACLPRTSTPVYGPWEEGLTLSYEDPSQSRRLENRLQVRVAHSEVAPGKPRLVRLELTSLQGRVSLLLRHQDGGIDMVDESGRTLLPVLPPRFPDLPGWTDRGTEFRIIGRATWEGAAVLPETSDPVGFWVEARPAQGPRRRILYLPNLGEVEAREERNGAWVAVNRLVARGFTDLPTSKRS